MNPVIQEVTQGSEAWHTLRASHHTASEAPAALGQSKYTTRNDLLKQKSTGVSKEVNGATQALFQRGHDAEAAARELAEQIIGADLFPVTVTLEVEGLKLLSSLDGQTMDDETIWEHKLWGEALAADVRSGNLAPHYTIQMDQQLLVTGAKRCLFMTSDGTAENMAYCWYETTPEKRAALIAGWKQFDADLVAYKAPAVVEAPVVAKAVTALPAIYVQVSGEVAIKENMSVFETAIKDFIENRLIREPKTDQDFADLELQIKAMKGAEAALDNVDAQLLSPFEVAEAIKRQKDMLKKLTRDNRLMAEKLLEAKKDQIRADMVRSGQQALADHIAALNASLGKPYMPQVPADFAGAIKGKRTIDSLRNAIDTTLAQAKIEADAIGRRISTNLNTLRDLAADHKALFPDTAQIVLKQPEDLFSLVKTRIAEHKAEIERQVQAEREAQERREAAARAEAERKAEVERVQAEQRAAAELARQEAERAAVVAAVSPAAEPEQPAALAPIVNVVSLVRPAPVVTNAVPTLRLGEINNRLGVLSVTADGLCALGFEIVAKDRAACLYRESDWPHMLAAMVKHLEKMQAKQAA
jgi:putative phage-type endonuclease